MGTLGEEEAAACVGTACPSDMVTQPLAPRSLGRQFPADPGDRPVFLGERLGFKQTLGAESCGSKFPCTCRTGWGLVLKVSLAVPPRVSYAERNDWTESRILQFLQGYSLCRLILCVFNQLTN